MELLTNPETWVALLTLTALEIVLGIDNIVFISIMAAKLPPGQQDLARRLGLGAAMVMRILLLLSISVIVSLTAPLFTIAGQEISGRDIILIGGGLFLIAKATFEIHERLEGEESHAPQFAPKAVTLGSVIFQIMLLDIVFSLDSVITAVGMANDIIVMVAAVVIAVVVMLFLSGPISRLIERHPSLKILALSFLLLIGTALIADGLELHVPKEYIYFAMGFSVLVEALNIRARHRGAPVQLREAYYKETDEPPTPSAA
jgi:predicted tellurium resistance membrane protein TerC